MPRTPLVLLIRPEVALYNARCANLLLDSVVCSLSVELSTAAQEITRREITGFNSEGMGLTATVLRFCAQEKLPVAITYIDAQSLREPVRHPRIGLYVHDPLLQAAQRPVLDSLGQC